jgi:hypothetical protein
MHDNNWLSVVAVCLSILTGTASIVVTLLNRGEKSGITQASLNQIKFGQDTLKMAVDTLTAGLAKAVEFIAKQEYANRIQEEQNRLRESREHELSQRISSLEATRKSRDE